MTAAAMHMPIEVRHFGPGLPAAVRRSQKFES
jgi:hypothetical protein